MIEESRAVFQILWHMIYARQIAHFMVAPLNRDRHHSNRFRTS